MVTGDQWVAFAVLPIHQSRFTYHLLPSVVGKLLLPCGGGYISHAHRTQRNNLCKRPQLSE
jgi:hypothetical protein